MSLNLLVTWLLFEFACNFVVVSERRRVNKHAAKLWWKLPYFDTLKQASNSNLRVLKPVWMLLKRLFLQLFCLIAIQAHIICPWLDKEGAIFLHNIIYWIYMYNFWRLCLNWKASDPFISHANVPSTDVQLLSGVFPMWSRFCVSRTVSVPKNIVLFRAESRSLKSIL